MSIPIIRLFKEDWLKNWNRSQAKRHRLSNTDLKHIQNFNRAIKTTSSGGYYIKYENRKKLVNGLKALNKASNAIQYFNNFPPNNRQRMAHTLKHYISSSREIYKNTRERMIEEFKKRKQLQKHRAYASKFKAYPSKVRGWNNTIRAPEINEEYITIPGFNGKIAKTPWTVYVRNRIVTKKRPSPKSPPNKLPNIPTNFGLWLGPYKNSNANNKYYQSPNRKLRYYPKRNVLVTNQIAYRKAANKFRLPRKEWM